MRTEIGLYFAGRSFTSITPYRGTTAGNSLPAGRSFIPLISGNLSVFAA